MYDNHEDILKYHNEEVRLPQKQTSEMVQLRDRNRASIKSGLIRDGEPAPDEFESQGSHAMLTMVQHPKNDYDIDDGVYFLKEDLVGPRDGDKTPQAAKEMVRKAIHSEHFNKAPEVLKNCVRIFYNKGYHVDLPVYRKIIDEDKPNDDPVYELASTDWKESVPRKVTEWFNIANDGKSPDNENGKQFRRITRLIKKFSKSRPSWAASTASGFILTVLVDECYQEDVNREDVCLHDIMKAIKKRLDRDLQVNNPVYNEELTNGEDDAKTRFFREKLGDAIEDLEILHKGTCTRTESLNAWGKVFYTGFFGTLDDDDDSTENSNKIEPGTDSKSLTKAIKERGDGRFA